MEESLDPPMRPKKGLAQQGYMEDRSRTATTPKRGLVREVCREWLVLEDGALAHQLQDEEISAHYGQNRDRNRLVRQDTPCARKEQEQELHEALEVQRLQREMRQRQEEEDARAAQQLAEELEKEEELQRKVTAIRDEQLARRLQSHVPKAKKNSANRQERYEALTGDCEPLSTSMRSMDLNQPMTEEEARQWQELCDAEMARKLQQQEEEESQWRRDVSDLSTRLAIEARDRELAQALQEKEKARLRKAKEKARLKSQQKAAQQQQHEEEYAAGDANFAHPQLGGNIAACIDPTWSRRQNIPQAIVHAPNEIYRPLPMTDLDFPVPVQPIVAGQRRASTHSQQAAETAAVASSPKAKKSSKCSHQ